MLLADKLVQQFGVSGIQVSNNATLETMPAVETEVMSLTANFWLGGKEADNARAQLNKLLR